MTFGFSGITGMARFTTLLLAAAFLFLSARHCPAAVCSNPGKDGIGAPGGIINTYYPGSGTAWAGSTTIGVGSADTSSGGSSTPIAAGDLLLVMQMQDADIASSNDQFYGGSTSGAGYTFLNNSGQYEYAVAAGPVSGSSIPLTAPLQNSYRSAAAFGSSGKRAFQVIRVPQYSSATLGAGLTAAPWNGNTGGVVVFDVAGQLSWGGQTIDVTGRGFRGGAGRQLAGQTGLSPTDYRTAAALTANGSKGEGIAGTPQYVFTPASAGPATNAGGVVTNTGSDGYPDGSSGRGAPGNAGGGGSDGNPSANDQNTGGGGGGAYSPGGMGGYGWTPGIPPGSKTGGYGGYAVPMRPGLLTLGGGGGAGSTNDGTGTPGSGLASSGAAGGGIVIVRAGSITGSGTINANGTNANSSILNDASGGGGGGGAVLIFSSASGGSVGSLTINVRGGNGGDNTGTGSPHGPGGGGSGGYVALTSAASVDVSGGINGTTAGSATSTPDYGSTTSAGGYQIFAVLPGQIPGAGATSLCYPVLTTGKTTGKANTIPGDSTSYTITVSNSAGFGTATGVTLSDPLPAPFSYAAPTGFALAGGATRAATSDPAVGTPSPSWGTFTIPGGGSVSLNFTASVPAGTAVGTYQNPANVTFANPAAGSPGAQATVTPGGSYYSGGPKVGGSNYNSASTTLEDVTVRLPATILKSFTPASVAPGGTALLSIVITNPNPTPLLNVGLTDNYPAGLTNAPTPNPSLSGAGCLGTVSAVAGGGSLSLSGAAIPATASCTITTNVTIAAGGSYTNVIPARALTSNLNITNTAPASAILSPPSQPTPAITAEFNPPLIQQNGTATLTFSIVNSWSSPLTNARFNDTLTNMQVAAAGSAGGSCIGAGTNILAAGQTALVLTGLTVPTGTTGCTVTIPVTSATPSPLSGYPNATSTGVASNEAPTGTVSNTAFLIVAGTPAIAKAFSPPVLSPSAPNSVMTFTLSNPGHIPLTGAAFSDTLTNIQVAPPGGPAGGTCSGATSNSFATGQTGSIVFNNLSIPADGSCTVTLPVSSSTPGANPNTASGVTSAQTPTAGSASNTATLTVPIPPSAAVSFSPGSIQSGATSSKTITISNSNGFPLTGVAFSDTLVNMQISASGAASGTCGGAGANAFTAGQTALTFSDLTIPSNGSCTVSVIVTSAALSAAPGHPNTTSSIASNETSPGNASATGYLMVLLAPSLTKSFGPTAIATGGTSTITFTVSNPNPVGLTAGSFTDNFPANLDLANAAQSYVGATRGTCPSAIPAGKIVGANPTPGKITFSGVTIPANGSCTLMVDVTSSTSGNYSNTAGGVATAQTPVSGNPSNTATLSVARLGLAKSFSPAIVGTSTNSALTFTLTNPTAIPQSGANFDDTYPVGLVNDTLTIGGTCTGVSVSAGTVTGGGVFNVTSANIPASGSCTITVPVKSATAGSYANTTATGLASIQTATRGAVSNTAVLQVVNKPTITVGINPATIGVNSTATLTYNLSNPNSAPLNVAQFSDTLSGFSVASSTLGGTCAGVTAPPAGATNLNLTVPNLLPGSCTITIQVTSATAGSYATQTTGVTSAQTTISAAPSQAPLTVVGSALTKSFSPAIVAAGTNSTVTFTITNGGGNPAQSGIGFTETLPADLTVVAPLTASQCGGTLTSSGPQNITLTSGSLASGAASCSITAQVTSSVGAAYNNTAANISGLSPGLTASGVNATLTVLSAPAITKAFGAASIGVGASTLLNMTVSNPNTGSALSGIAFTDSLPSGLTAVNGSTAACGGTLVITGGNTLTFTGGSLAASASCLISTTVTASTAGAKINTTSAVTASGPIPLTGAISNTATLSVSSAPTIAKSFSVASAALGASVNMSFLISNGNDGGLSGVGFTDTLPAGLSAINGSTAICGGTLVITGSNLLTFSNGVLAGSASCTITVPITGTLPGVHSNTSGVISSNESGNGLTSNTATVSIYSPPLVTKSFTPANIPIGGTSSMIITVSNPVGNPDNLTGVSINDSYTGTLSNNAAGSVICTGVGSATLTGGGNLGTSVGFTSGTLAPGGSCTITQSVTATSNVNNTTDAPAAAGPVAVTGTPAGPVVLSVAGVSMSGSVYADNNNNGMLDSGESGTGQTVFVKLVSDSCSGTFQQVIAADAATGAFAFSGVSPGPYCLLLSTNSTPDTTTGAPSGWTGMEGSGGRMVNVSSTSIPGQNFGLYNGFRVTGTVFSDTGSGGGTANDGQQNGAEAGISAVSVRLADEAGTTIYDTRMTDSSGNFTLHIPATIANGTSLKISEINPPGYISTGASVGNSGGNYDRTGDAVTITFNGTGSSGIAFADVPDNRFLSDNTVSALPGAVVFHPHSFIAGSGGSVSFTTTAVASPSLPGWSEVLYRDTNCNGSFDNNEPQVTASIPLVADEQLCILMKEFVPANAPLGASDLVSVTATFTFTNAGPALSRLLTRTDTTQVGTASGAGLILTKAVDQVTALPGSNLTYTITYANSSSGPLSNIVIHDSVPAYTTYVDACCVNPGVACLGSPAAVFPPAITACTATISGETITWTATGALAPGASGQVKFRVTVQN